MCMENEKIYVFDAYGTLFDVDHACKEMAIQLGDNWEKLSSIWRQKQLEYSWLHNSMNEYDSFSKITKDSLEYAMNSLSMNSVKIKNELLDLYFKIGAFEEVEEVLKKIKKNKIKLAYKKYLIKGIKERNNKISRHFAERLILNKNFEDWKKLNNSKKSYYEYLGDVYGE